MVAETGKQYHCTSHGTTVIVTRGGEGSLMCQGGALELGRGTAQKKPGDEAVIVLGKRYSWPEVPPPPKEGESPPTEVVPRVEVLCIGSGDCALAVEENLMLEIPPKVLPSAD